MKTTLLLALLATILGACESVNPMTVDVSALQQHGWITDGPVVRTLFFRCDRFIAAEYHADSTRTIIEGSWNEQGGNLVFSYDGGNGAIGWVELSDSSMTLGGPLGGVYHAQDTDPATCK